MKTVTVPALIFVVANLANPRDVMGQSRPAPVASPGVSRPAFQVPPGARCVTTTTVTYPRPDLRVVTKTERWVVDPPGRPTPVSGPPAPSLAQAAAAPAAIRTSRSLVPVESSPGVSLAGYAPTGTTGQPLQQPASFGSGPETGVDQAIPEPAGRGPSPETHQEVRTPWDSDIEAVSRRLTFSDDPRSTESFGPEQWIRLFRLWPETDMRQGLQELTNLASRISADHAAGRAPDTDLGTAYGRLARGVARGARASSRAYSVVAGELRQLVSGFGEQLKHLDATSSADRLVKENFLKAVKDYSTAASLFTQWAGFFTAVAGELDSMAAVYERRSKDRVPGAIYRDAFLIDLREKVTPLQSLTSPAVTAPDSPPVVRRVP